MHVVKLVSDAEPGVVGGVFDDADEEQPEPTELGGGADAVLAVMDNRLEQKSLFISPKPCSAS